LESRGEDAPEVISKRLAVAEDEMARRGEFDHVVVSGTREADAAAVQEIYSNAKSE
jgi:guanylate kinase